MQYRVFLLSFDQGFYTIMPLRISLHSSAIQSLTLSIGVNSILAELTVKSHCSTVSPMPRFQDWRSVSLDDRKPTSLAYNVSVGTCKAMSNCGRIGKIFHTSRRAASRYMMINPLPVYHKRTDTIVSVRLALIFLGSCC